MFKMDLNVIDVELFIREVEKRPVLWDVNRRDYRHLKKKKRTWVEVAAACVPNFDKSMYSEKLLYQNLKEKWRNLRDSYVRAKRLKNTRYYYMSHLAFLDAIYSKRNGSSDGEARRSGGTPETEDVTVKIEADYIDCSNSEFDGTSSLDGISRKLGAREMGIEFIGTNHEYSETSGVRQSNSGDDDRCFFDSLLPAIREFDMDQKLEFRSDILASIKRIRSKS